MMTDNVDGNGNAVFVLYIGRYILQVKCMYMLQYKVDLMIFLVSYYLPSSDFIRNSQEQEEKPLNYFVPWSHSTRDR